MDKRVWKNARADTNLGELLEVGAERLGDVVLQPVVQLVHQLRQTLDLICTALQHCDGKHRRGGRWCRSRASRARMQP